MIPQDIYERYYGFKNPYREILTDNGSAVAYEYSDQIPSWHLEYFYSADGYPSELIKSAIDRSESRGYYSFYYLCDSKNFSQHLTNLKLIDPRYEIILDEIIPANEKSINTLFWDWICKTMSRPEETYIILHILPRTYRK